ncbi:MAG: RnfABCDGE type electron transport complex subunit D [Polyangia bacterium]
MEKTRYVVSISPHVRHGRTIRSMMVWTIVALAPAAAWGIYQFGLPAAVLIAVAVAGAVGTEALVNALARKPQSAGDGHAVLVGLLLALMLPAGVPWWMALVAAATGILVGKMPFGPLGGAPLNPALVGLLIVAISWPAMINSYSQPATAPEALRAPDAAPAEHPLSAVLIDPSDVAEYDPSDLFLGHQVGPIGGISPLLLLLGGLFLLQRRTIRWHAPLGFLLGIVVSAGLAHALDPQAQPPVWFHTLTGLTMLGAFFLGTDWTSTPVTPWGMFLFGLLAGVLTVILRMTGLHYGRVPWAIFAMSLATPLFDRIASVPFGKVVHHA